VNTSAAHPLIVELELWLPPQSDRAPLDGKGLAARCRHETGLSSDVVLGLSFVPNEQDVAEVKRAIEAGEIQAEAFQRFLKKRGLPSHTETERSAAEFLAFVRGQPLAWLHLPAESPGLAMAQALTEWARKNNLQVHDGARTYEQLADSQVYALWQRAA